MKPSAIQQSEQRLRKAASSRDRLIAASNYEEQEEAWIDFLLSINGIYSKLEQGANDNGKSKAWFGRKKSERKKDPLLRYLKFARNAEEHGLRRVTEQIPAGWSKGPLKPAFNERRVIFIQAIDDVTDQPFGKARPGLITGARIKCVRAYDSRFKDYCDVPEFHLGKKIYVPEIEVSGSDYVDVLASTAIPFFRSLIDEAKSLIR